MRNISLCCTSNLIPGRRPLSVLVLTPRVVGRVTEQVVPREYSPIAGLLLSAGDDSRLAPSAKRPMQLYLGFTRALLMQDILEIVQRICRDIKAKHDVDNVKCIRDRAYSDEVPHLNIRIENRCRIRGRYRTGFDHFPNFGAGTLALEPTNEELVRVKELQLREIRYSRKQEPDRFLGIVHMP